MLAAPGHAESEPDTHGGDLQHSHSAFSRSDFSELNRSARVYRTEKSRSASGLWRLTSFYTGIKRAIAAERNGMPGSENEFALVEKKTVQWARAFPDQPAPHIVHASLLMERAWAFRGHDYARKVDVKNWAPFRYYLAMARQYLEANKKVAAVDPQWYVEMLIIAKAQNWNRADFERLLAEALDHEPLFYQTYFMALNYLLPKWHGDIFEIEAFAQSAVKRTSMREGRGLYARIYWYASQAQFNNRLFEESRVDWLRMRDGFEDVIKQFPDSWNLNNYAKFACLAKDKAKVQQLMERIGTDIVADAWDPPSQQVDCMLWATRTTSSGI